MTPPPALHATQSSPQRQTGSPGGHQWTSRLPPEPGFSRNIKQFATATSEATERDLQRFYSSYKSAAPALAVPKKARRRTYGGPQVDEVGSYVDAHTAEHYYSFLHSTWPWDEEERQVQRVTEAATLEDIISALGHDELDPVASRLSELARLAEEDENEPPTNVGSAREMVIFLIRSQGQLGQPRIAINPDGLLLVEYRIAESGVLAVEFLSSDLVRYAAVSAAATAGIERTRISGTVPKNVALSMIRQFIVNLK